MRPVRGSFPLAAEATVTTRASRLLVLGLVAALAGCPGRPTPLPPPSLPDPGKKAPGEPIPVPTPTSGPDPVER